MTKRDPLISILLPTHNRADVLPFAIGSVLGQTIQDFELLIVGDGCTDQTAKIVDGFGDPRIVWFDLPKGPRFGYANRNIALRQARGAYIAFMAHDDFWFPDHLELLLPILAQPGIELVYSRPMWVLPDGKIAPSIFDLNDEETLAVFLARKKNRIPALCVVHRRECFDKYGYWDENLPGGADWDMWIRIIKGGGMRNFVYLPEPTSLHFRADWRKKFNSVLEHEIVWEHFYALDGFVPDAMKIAVPDGMTEQEAIWQVMSVQPQEWANQIRAAIRQVFDRRVAHSDELIVWMLQRWPALRCDAASLIAQIEDQSTALSKYRAELESSLTWKLFHKLQALKQGILPPGTSREKFWLRMTQNLKK